jgi:Cu+-exporting ATPase
MDDYEMKDVKWQEVVLGIEGMTCSACTGTIEDNLKTQKGIKSVRVTLALQEATIKYYGISIPNIKEMIEDLGFDVVSEKLVQDNHQKGQEQWNEIELRILGMTCSSCSNAIEALQYQNPKIRTAQINLLQQTGFFVTQLALRDLITEIESLGFDALTKEKNNSQFESLNRTKEIIRWRNSFFNSLAFAVPVMFIEMWLPMLSPTLAEASIVKGLSWSNLIMCLLTIPVQFIIGRHFYVKSIKSVRYGSYTMDLLITIGTTLSFAFSVLSILYSVIRGGSPEPEVFFETSVMLITFVTLGRYLENIAKGETGNALSKLLSMKPQNCCMLEINGDSVKETIIETELIKKGDILKILGGERFPCDGVISFGSTSVDESMLTGESLPFVKEEGDKVIAGTVNLISMIHIKATKVGDETTLSQIVELVQKAQAGKAPIQEAADKVSSIFVPMIITLSTVTFCVWIYVTSFGGFRPARFPTDASDVFVALSMAISVIVVACPCALGLATPTAMLVGTGVGAKLGVLIKSGAVLETAGKITKVVFDKTGTLTQGTMSVSLFEIFSTYQGIFSKDDILQIVGLVETTSEHPIGKSIVRYSNQNSQNTNQYQILKCESLSGHGIQAIISHKFKSDHKLTITVGNLKCMGMFEIDNENEKEIELQYAQEGRTVVFFAIDKQVTGVIALSDQLKPESKDCVEMLKAMGLQVAMVTGDLYPTAKFIADEIGIDEVYAGVTPAGKLEIVKQMQQRDIVCMIGDGVNDSASLVQCDLGIAVFGGTDIAVSAADIVLMRDDLMDLIVAIDLSKTIFRRIWLNFMFATIYNLLMVPLAMGVGAKWGNFYINQGLHYLPWLVPLV